MRKMMKRLTVLLALMLATASWAADITHNGRENFENSFTTTGYQGFAPYASDPATCNTKNERGMYYNTTSNQVRVCDGVSWHAVTGGSSSDLYVRAGTNLAAGDLVYISSYNATSGAPVASLADADVANGQAVYIALAVIASGSTGTVYRQGTATLDTSLSAIGNPVYLTVTGTTGNTLSLAAPTGADDRVQIVGRVATVAAAGTVWIDLTANSHNMVAGTTDIQADAITAAKIAADAVGASEIAANAVGSSEIATDAVGSDEIAANAVDTSEIKAGAVTPTKLAISCANASGGNYAAGDFVYINGHDGTNPTCALSDADVALGRAQYVVTAACNTGTTCVVARSALITGVDTSAVGAVGDPLYLTTTGTTTNTWSAVAPTGSDDVVQIVARVTIDNAAGAFLADLQSLPTSKIASNEIQAASVLNAALAANAVTTDKITDGTIRGADMATRGAKCSFRDPPMQLLADNSAVAAVGAGSTNQLVFPDCLLWLYVEEAIAGSVNVTPSTSGMDFGYDDADNDGVQIRVPQYAGGRGAFTGQTDAFYATVTATLQDASGVDPFCIGLMTPQAGADIDALAGLDSYGAAGEEVAALCVGSGAGVDPAKLHTYTKVNGGGSVDTELTTSTWADGATHTLRINVSAAGVVTYQFDGSTPAEVVALTLTADTFFPFIVHDSSGDVNDNAWLSAFEYGIQ